MMDENFARRIFRIIFIAMLAAGTVMTIWGGLNIYRIKKAQHMEIERAIEDVFENGRSR
ncbi:MAG: hypothetical protein LBI17_00220 [Rickettsiales bacterium]|jgi:hypothetical protein|nr:hypothetical protein [Rickettsiales bacterium]